MSGVHAVTISSNTTLSSATTYSENVTVDPGVRLTITSEVTITGNLTNNGGTIIVGEGGVLTVNGNVTNTSVSKSVVTTTETTYAPTRAATYPQMGDHKYVVETSTNYDLGTLSLTNGGQVNVNGNFTNNTAELTVTTLASDAISRISVKGNFINSTPSVTGEKNVRETRYTYSSANNRWQDARVTSNVTETLTTSRVILSNGYLLVDGNVELQDNSTVIFAGTGIGEDIESTIRVRKEKDETGGNMTQSANAIITLASGAKGKLIVAEDYTDNTTSDGNANHPWSITDEGTLTMNDGFDLYATKYVSSKLDAKIDEINNLLDDLSEQLEAIDGKSLEEYLQILYPEQYNTYITGNYSWRQTYVEHYGSFSKYLYQENRGFWGALSDFFGGNGYGNFTQTMTEQQTEAINELKNEIATNTTLKETFEDLIETLEQEGVHASEIAAQSSSVSSILPIELTSFIVSATDYGFEFNWVTASENENDYFTLEYSIDGVDFNEIDYVHGAGTTSETSEYEYRWDEAPEFDVIYFRLKQTDYNGEYSYSNVIIASRKKSSGANGTFRYGPLNLQIVDGQLRHIIK